MTSMVTSWAAPLCLRRQKKGKGGLYADIIGREVDVPASIFDIQARCRKAVALCITSLAGIVSDLLLMWRLCAATPRPIHSCAFATGPHCAGSCSPGLPALMQLRPAHCFLC